MQADSTTRKRAGQSVLVLTGPARLSVERGRLRVEDGFGNLGTSRTLDLECPLFLQSIILLTQGGVWSDHALRMLAENDAPVYRVTQAGEVLYSVLPPGGPMKPGLLRLQASLPDSDVGVQLARQLILKKVEGQAQTIGWLSTKAALPGLQDYQRTEAQLISAVEQTTGLDEVRFAEARAADHYFTAWRQMPVCFRKPAKGCVEVPSHWSRWQSRRSLRTNENRDATDPLNALLNFVYAITMAETLICCRAASLDPSLGLIHADQDGRPNFIYDLMEPLRPLADRLVLELVVSRTFQMNRDFILLRGGLCRLGIEFAAEVGRLVSEWIRPEAENLSESVRKSLLSVAAVTYRVQRATTESAK